MKVVISALHFAWDDIEQCLARAGDEFGLDGVELSFHPTMSPPHCTEDDLGVVRAAAERRGLILSAHIWENLPGLGAADGAQVLERWLQACRRTGVTDLIVHGGAHPDQQAGIRQVGDVFGGVIGSFESAGVVLNVENHYPYGYRQCGELFSEPWEFLELFRTVPSPCLRFCFDTGHAHMSRNTRELLREVGPHLNYVHLADNHGEHDDHCGYGEGTVEWESLLGQLGEIGFEGPFCVEFPVREDMEPFRRCMHDLRQRF